MKKKVLFVCLGNTCRSPMAEYLARRRFDPGQYHFESAGIYAKTGGEMALNASEVLATHFFINTSGFVSRNLNDVDVKKFDILVAVDFSVVADLKNAAKSGAEIIALNVEDPFGESSRVYLDCAFEIIRQLDNCFV